MTVRPVLLAVLALTLIGPAAQAATPELHRVLPRGGQRGTELTLSLRGKRLGGPQEVFLYRPGIEVVALKAKGPKHVAVTIRIAADCPLGEHALRLRTVTGVTDLRTFYVGALPETAEREPNGAAGIAQVVSLNTTLTGVIAKEDVDLFAFQGTKGQAITAELEGLRLGEVLFDPYLAILDAKGFELVATDDAALTGPDPVVSLVLPADGTYWLSLRDSAYRGGPRYQYRLHVGTFPRPLAVIPSGGSPGASLALRFLGDPKGPFEQTLTLPPSAANATSLVPERDGLLAPSPLPFRLSTLPSLLESEPNSRKKPNPIAIPAAVHGILQTPGDVDFFQFDAKKNQVFFLRAFCRQLGSPCDPVLNVFHTGGKHIGGNDDNRGAPDSVFRFKVPADGSYTLRVRDFLNRGGPTHVYRVEVDVPRPQLSLTLRHYGRPDSQERQAIAIPRGNRFAVLVQAQRLAFGGELSLSFEGLPAGVTVTTPTIHKAVGVVPVVFEAAPTAPVAGTLTRLRGKLADPKRAIEGGLRHRTNLVMGAPNNAVYWTRDDDRLAVAVTRPAPFTIRLEAPAVPLVRNGSAQLRVVATRDDGFVKPIDVFLLSNPPGCGSRRKVTIAKGKTEVRIPINANGRAALGRWPLVAVARSGHGGPLWVSSGVQYLEVAAPYVTAKLSRAAGERGTVAELHCALKVLRPFPGKAPAKLHGLPPGVSAPTLFADAKTTELRFPLTVAPNAKLGNHRPLCQLIVQQDGHPIAHTLGQTKLRIDAPLKKQKKPTAPPPPGKRPPSRLEQLRDEFARQAEGGPQ